eukprot:6205187-Pleurochrysis_carterae.AAC.4
MPSTEIGDCTEEGESKLHAHRRPLQRTTSCVGAHVDVSAGIRRRLGRERARGCARPCAESVLRAVLRIKTKRLQARSKYYSTWQAQMADCLACCATV